LLPSSCRVHCPCLLLCFFYVWCLHAQRLSSLGTTCRVNRCCGGVGRSMVMLALSTLAPASYSKIHSCSGDAGVNRTCFSCSIHSVLLRWRSWPIVDRSVGVPPLTSIGSPCTGIGDSLLLFVLPISIGLLVRLSISESCGLPRSHIVVPNRTSASSNFIPVMHSSSSSSASGTLAVFIRIILR
jgi:hypothetical protein